MPRPCKKRRICGMPKNRQFSPSNIENPDSITMTLDEYEVIRLIDLEGLTQEECAVQMNISRPSVSAISESAHKKLAEMLVESKVLHIDGGHVAICEKSKNCCGTCGKKTCLECQKDCFKQCRNN